MEETTKDTPQSPAEAAPEAAEGPQADKAKSRKPRRVLMALSALVLACCVACAGVIAWRSSAAGTDLSADPGATVKSYEGMSDEEIQADLDAQAEASRMTISVAPTVTLADGRCRVNVVNVEDNRFDQTFTLSQGGKTLYESGLVKPGETVEWCDAADAATGEATITVQAHDAETGEASGNPQSVAVTIEQG